MNDLIEEIIAFWFGELDENNLPDKSVQLRWWQKNADFDQVIRDTFSEYLPLALAGEFDSWRDSAVGCLALIILCDQFPRNCFRDSDQAWAYDAYAREVALSAIEQGFDQQLLPIQRVFMYMPLEHAEDLSLQERCVELFRVLSDDVPDDQNTIFANFLDYAKRHRDVIAQYGRFPHRNQFLARQSTPAEVEYLAQENAGF